MVIIVITRKVHEIVICYLHDVPIGCDCSALHNIPQYHITFAQGLQIGCDSKRNSAVFVI